MGEIVIGKGRGQQPRRMRHWCCISSGVLGKNAQGALDMCRMDLRSLLIQQALLFQPFGFLTQLVRSSERFCLNVLPSSTTLGCGGLCLGGIRFAHGVCFPQTHAASQKLGTIGFADQFPLQKEVNDGQVTPVVVDVNFFPPQPIEHM